MQNFLIIGKIGSAYGILGWNHIYSYTEKIENILKYTPWFIKKNSDFIIINIKKKKIYNNKIYIKLENIDNRNQAKQLVNKNIFTERTTLPLLPISEYYWQDIISCMVFSEKNQLIGIVTDIIRSKLNDILIIQNINDKNKKKILIPFIQNTFIKKINIIKKKIYVILDI